MPGKRRGLLDKLNKLLIYYWMGKSTARGLKYLTKPAKGKEAKRRKIAYLILVVGGILALLAYLKEKREKKER